MASIPMYTVHYSPSQKPDLRPDTHTRVQSYTQCLCIPKGRRGAFIRFHDFHLAQTPAPGGVNPLTEARWRHVSFQVGSIKEGHTEEGEKVIRIADVSNSFLFSIREKDFDPSKCSRIIEVERKSERPTHIPSRNEERAVHKRLSRAAAVLRKARHAILRV